MTKRAPPSSFEFSPWRHGGWYVDNVQYASGAIGCVSNNYTDKRWRIVCDGRPGADQITYATREAAAMAEWHLAEQSKAAPAAPSEVVPVAPARVYIFSADTKYGETFEAFATEAAAREAAWGFVNEEAATRLMTDEIAAEVAADDLFGAWNKVRRDGDDIRLEECTVKGGAPAPADPSKADMLSALKLAEPVCDDAFHDAQLELDKAAGADAHDRQVLTQNRDAARGALDAVRASIASATAA